MKFRNIILILFVLSGIQFCLAESRPTDSLVAISGIVKEKALKRSSQKSVDNFNDVNYWNDYDIIGSTEFLEKAVFKLKKRGKYVDIQIFS